MDTRRTISVLIAMTLILAACSSGAADGGTGSITAAESTPTGATADGSVDGSVGAPTTDGSQNVDPREGGLDVALGEWALTLEAGTIRPGRVTFVVVNRGTVPHGFEIEAEGGDSSGHGSGDGLKAETRVLQPGERTRLSLSLAAGLYKVECLVDGHDDMGMEGFLEVRKNAPLVRVDAGSPVAASVAIEGFEFAPSELEVLVGEEITWTNADPAPHTVTADNGSFDSGTLEPGRSFTLVAEGNGPVTYVCLIHPEMTGTLLVG